MVLHKILKKIKQKEKEMRLVILCKLNIWDVGGQKSLRVYWKNYFESTDGVIWVVDSADSRRLKDTSRELHNLLQEEILDLDSVLSHHWHIMPCSAVTGDNLIQGIDWIVTDVKERLFGIH